MDTKLNKESKAIIELMIADGIITREDAEKYFPELKNEDERIRTFLHKTFTEQYLAKDKLGKWHGEPVVNILTWLEKKGESKPIGKLQLSEELYEHIRNTCACIDDALSSKKLADINDYLSMAERSAQSAFNMIEKQGSQNLANSAKTCNDEQKFKVGDWLIRNDIVGVAFYITQIHESYYLTNEHSFINFREEDKYRLWTIQDAKDGDVLADGNLPFIFKKIDANKHSYAYCGISVDDGFKIESDGESGEWTWMQDIKPATKEQRDLLFQKMGEAGYEWDAEKKELKKIEQKPTIIIPKFRVGDKIRRKTPRPYDKDMQVARVESNYYLCNHLGKFSSESISFSEESNYELVEHNPTWSEEDEEMCSDTIQFIEKGWTDNGKSLLIPWLRTLKGRMQSGSHPKHTSPVADKDAEGVFGLKKNGDLIHYSKVDSKDKDEYESIVIVKGHTCIKMALHNPKGEFTFDEAQKAAASLGEGWRCPTRHEWIDIYDSRFSGLDELIKKLGADPIESCYWTCEADADPQYSSTYSWTAFNTGFVNRYYRRATHRVCAVSAFQN